ncbi:aldehyde dehydrogenase family protein [Marinobacterium mangrovicola]|uniref:Phenylacetaldehyde dehydrogenase n=1 Tax=Marinobacterium mangrovicola TaxID=1476959 RepID=A0A4R1GSV7_9GAMM|nr:aldehyde dehydrogenase family protein [Marinobacterium mangrovicola]TCK09329.1 phenylacetaldehyde dehydrogenase [Marinobacterium mangrovicola]
MNQIFTFDNPLAGISDVAKQFLARKHSLFINGKWEAPVNGGTRNVEDPATGQIISTMAEGDAADIDIAVRSARKAFEDSEWSRMSTNDRAKIVWRIGELIDENAQELAELETLDEGSPFGICKNFYVKLAADHFRYYAGWANKLTGSTVPTNMAGQWHSYTLREPVGVVGQIIPWNVPLLMAAWKVSPALAAGCTIVLKPAEDTPLTALRFAEICREAGLPDGVLNVVTGAGAAGQALVDHPDVDKIAFTGSTETGKAIVRAAASNLKRVSLELGGKSPVIVFPDADLEKAIPGVAQAVMFNSGQACTAGSRLYIHEDIYDEVVAGVAEYTSSLKLGHGLDPNTNMGPLISARQHARVSSLLQSGIDEGAKVMQGDVEMPGSEGYFIRPTVLADVNSSMKVYHEEIFGPVICAMKFDSGDMKGLVQEANNSSYGLAASIWTRDLSIAHQMAAKVRAGVVWVNNHNQTDAALPFGGYKQSGWGREMGLAGLEQYTENKSVGVYLGE